MKYYNGCTALITGATAGIGNEFAKQLAPVAQTLVLVARRTERLEALARELRSAYPGLVVHCRSVDLSDEPQIDGLIEWLDASELNVNVLINNAGLGDYGDFAGADLGKAQARDSGKCHRAHEADLFTAPDAAKISGGIDHEREFHSELHACAKLAVYAASKAYVTSLTEALRAELRGTGIGVITVCPGPVDTEFGSVAERNGAGHLPPPDMLKIPAAQVAYESLVAAANGRARVVPGLMVALFAGLMCLAPMIVVRLYINKAARIGE